SRAEWPRAGSRKTARSSARRRRRPDAPRCRASRTRSCRRVWSRPRRRPSHLPSSTLATRPPGRGGRHAIADRAGVGRASVPPFDKVKVEEFKPALEASMAEALAETDKIAANAAPPTFENTIAALERTGRTLDRVSNVFGIYSSTMSTPDFQKVEEEMAPKL